MAKYEEISLIVTHEQSELLLKLLNGAEKTDKQNVVFQKLYRNVQNINVLWKKREKASKEDAARK